jgi:uncharacterized membrane protein YkvA (DUF1232 family)
MRDLAIFVLAGIAALYLINPTAGILEFIPDNFPLIGNLDEAGATAIILSALAYFGIDLNHLFGNRDKPKRGESVYLIDEARAVDDDLDAWRRERAERAARERSERR